VTAWQQSGLLIKEDVSMASGWSPSPPYCCYVMRSVFNYYPYGYPESSTSLLTIYLILLGIGMNIAAKGESAASQFQLEIEERIAAKRSVKGSLRHADNFAAWSREEGFDVRVANYEAISGYLCMFVLKQKGSSKSVDAILHSLRVLYETVGADAWLTASEIRNLRKLVSEIKYLDSHRINRKRPIRLSALHEWTDRLDLTLKRDLMLTVLCYMGHDGLLRLGELLSGLTTANILWSYDRRSFSVVLDRSKVNRQGDPERIEIPDHRGRSAVKVLIKWYDQMQLWGMEDAILFPAWRRSPDGSKGTVSASWFRAHLKELVRSNGYDPSYYSGHSLRAGGATDLFVARVPYFLIKKMGRWKSDAAMLYYRSEEDVVAAVSRAFSKWG